MTVLLLATTTGYQIRSFSDAARALDVRLVFGSDRCDHLDDPWRDAAIPVRFHDLAGSTRRIVEAFGGTPPDGVLAVGDRPSVLDAHAAEAFGLRGNPPEAAARSRNKRAAREAFQAAGLLTPEYRHVPVESDARALADGQSYPVVVKPLGLSGSRGVMRADNAASFVAVFTRLRRLLGSIDIRLERDQLHDAALIEAFIPGREFAVEGVLTAGAFSPFAIFDKPDPLDGPFFEETIYVTPSRADEHTQRSIVTSVAAAARALGLVHGPVHAECRVNDQGVYVLEVAARPIGGLCSRALRFMHRGKTVSLEEVLLRHAIGDPLDDTGRELRASGVMMIPIPHRGVFRGVDGEELARGLALIEAVHITAKPDTLLTPLPEGRSYLGFIFAAGDTPDAVEQALRAAHRQLVFRIDRDLPIVVPA